MRVFILQNVIQRLAIHFLRAGAVALLDYVLHGGVPSSCTDASGIVAFPVNVFPHRLSGAPHGVAE